MSSLDKLKDSMQKTKSNPISFSSSQYAWLVLAAVYFASVSAPFNQFKVPPILPTLMDRFSLNLSQGGLLMSSVALTSLILALPAGLIVQRFGFNLSGLFALLCLAMGAGLGALSSGFQFLILSRIVEGIGIGLIGVIAPAAIAQWFPPERQGTAMGIWATWVPVGSLLMYNLAPFFSQTFGWQSVWWVGAAFCVITALFYGLIVRQPPQTNSGAEEKLPKNDFGQALANRDIWLLGGSFVCFNLVLVTLSTYYPTFLNEVYDYPLAQASFLTSIPNFVILFSAPFAGWLSDRLNSRRLLFSIPFIAVMVMLLFPFRVHGTGIVILMIIQGLLIGAIPTATFAAAAEIMRKPQWASLGLAVILFSQYIGQLIGPVLFGNFVLQYGWFIAGLLLIPFSCIGFLTSWLVRVR